MNKYNIKVFPTLFVSNILFLFVFTLTSAQLEEAIDSTEQVSQLVNLFTSIAVGIAFLFFFWNLGKFILKEDGEAKEIAVRRMGWSSLAIFFIVSIWGVIGFIGEVVGIDPEKEGGRDPINIPGINRKA